MAYMGLESAKELIGIEGVDTFLVAADADKLGVVETEMKKFCGDQCLFLHSFANLRQKLNARLDGVIGSLWGLMGLGFIMGALGMANTLMMNVLEQTRELALLRVVAMTRHQVAQDDHRPGRHHRRDRPVHRGPGRNDRLLHDQPQFHSALRARGRFRHAPGAGAMVFRRGHGDHPAGCLDPRRTRRRG